MLCSMKPDGYHPLEWARWFIHTDNSIVKSVRETVNSVLVVILIGALLFGASGVWPPLVAVTSESMEPHVSKGDLVFVVDEHRLSPDFAVRETGVVTAQRGKEKGYRSFGGYGDIIVYQPDGVSRITAIHRAHFWVNESENWANKANKKYVPNQDCTKLPNCPAPHAGFITKGDNNQMYDQVNGVSGPVKPSQIRGTVEVRIPYLGYIRLAITNR